MLLGEERRHITNAAGVSRCLEASAVVVAGAWYRNLSRRMRRQPFVAHSDPELPRFLFLFMGLFGSTEGRACVSAPCPTLPDAPPPPGGCSHKLVPAKSSKLTPENLV